VIGTLLRLSWLTLRRDRVALLLTFVLPILFFTVISTVFGGLGSGGGTGRIRIAVADLDRTEASARFVRALVREPGLSVLAESGDPPRPLDEAAAAALVRGGKRPVALVIKPGFGAQLGDFTATTPALDLLSDKADPIAAPMVQGLIQKVGMSAMPDLMAEHGLGMFETFAGGFTPQQRQSVDRLGQMLRSQAKRDADGPAENAGNAADRGASADGPEGGSHPAPSAVAPQMAHGPAPDGGFAGPIAVNVVDLIGQTKRSGMIAYYAASSAVMFLLFAMAGAAGTLLDEEEAGTLERLLGSGVTIGMLLGAKWAFYALAGVVQITVMFLWGMLFGLEFLEHLPGFTVMAASTAAAAAAFGLVLASLSRTRAQLSGLSTVVILLMSALGGCMFPRMFMPSWAVNLGYATFNAWALDGFLNIFWYERGLWSIWPQVLVLLGLTALLLTIARLLARRWEAV
jgi:ABC-2 type transport system permease protein